MGAPRTGPQSLEVGCDTCLLSLIKKRSDLPGTGATDAAVAAAAIREKPPPERAEA